MSKRWLNLQSHAYAAKKESNSPRSACWTLAVLFRIQPHKAAVTGEITVAVVEVMPESASLFVDSISEGDESAEGEWMSRLDEAPREINDMDEPDTDAKKP